MARSVVELLSAMPDLPAQLGQAVVTTQAGVCLVSPGWRTGRHISKEIATMRAQGIPIIGKNVAFSRTYGLREKPTREDAKLVDELAATVAKAIGNCTR
jgi:hypothetical protein